MTDQRVEAPGVSVELRIEGEVAPPVVHRIHLIERGPFIVAQCLGCGWETFARRSRPLARQEGRDHEVLHRPMH